MMMPRLSRQLRRISRSQAGVTLAELLIAVGIMSVMFPLVGSQLFAALSTGKDWRDDIGATVNLRRAASYVSRDAAIADSVSLGIASAPADTLDLDWTDTTDTPHNVTYALSGSDLVRTIDSSSLIIARGVTYLQFSRAGDLLTLDLTVAGATGTTDSITASTALARVQ